MAPKTFQAAFDEIFDEAFELLVSRQRKYGPENVRQLGIFGVFGRLADDKVERIRRAMNGKISHGKVELDNLADFTDESVEDALFDIANYALILIALKRGVWGLPLAEDVRGRYGDDEPSITRVAVVSETAKDDSASIVIHPSTVQDSWFVESGNPNPCCADANAVSHTGPCIWCEKHGGVINK